MDGYSIFLMIELAKISGIINKNLAYDLLWNVGCELYSEFEGSVFDDENDSEYNCMHSFLLHKKQVILLGALKNLKDKGMDVTARYGTIYLTHNGLELQLSDDEINTQDKEYLQRKSIEDLED